MADGSRAERPHTGGAGLPVCYRHPSRETGIRCQRCDRPICPDCMQPASVGFQCPECVREGARSTRQRTGAYGGRRSANPMIASLALIGANVLVWLVIQAMQSSDLVEELALIPAAVSPSRWWTPLTSMFTHIQFFHLAMNMFGLYLLGPAVESMIGRTRFLAVYLISGLAGSAAVMLLSEPFSGTVGASGAIYGLLGALLILALKRRGDTRQLWTLIAINVAITAFGYAFISWQAHLGGFVGGLAATAAVAFAPKVRRSMWQWLILALLLLVAVSTIAASALS